MQAQTVRTFDLMLRAMDARELARVGVVSPDRQRTEPASELDTAKDAGGKA